MSGGGSTGGGVFPDTQQGGGATAAGGDGATGSGADNQEPTQKKRKPILTLKAERVFSEKGLRYVEKEFPKLKFRGKGHEVSTILLVNMYMYYWLAMVSPQCCMLTLFYRQLT